MMAVEQIARARYQAVGRAREVLLARLEQISSRIPEADKLPPDRVRRELKAQLTSRIESLPPGHPMRPVYEKLLHAASHG
jgi:hypothetical protein